MKTGAIIKSKVCPILIGKVVELIGNKMAIVEVGDKQMVVHLEYWEEIK